VAQRSDYELERKDSEQILKTMSYCLHSTLERGRQTLLYVCSFSLHLSMHVTRDYQFPFRRSSGNVGEPLVCQCLVSRESPIGVHIHHPYDKILEIKVDILPQCKRPPWIVRIEVRRYHCNKLSPGTVAKVPNQTVYTLEIREVRKLTFENNVQEFDALWYLFFVYC
jgi:hypothetical protein